MPKARHSSKASGLGSFDVVRTKMVLSSLFVSAAASTLMPPSRLARQKERFAVSEVRGSPSRATSLRVSPTRAANLAMSAERSPGMVRETATSKVPSARWPGTRRPISCS